MLSSALKTLQYKWKSYRHRFVPWIALNLRKNERTIRQVFASSEDKLVPDEQVTKTLLQLFRALLRKDLKQHEDALSLLPLAVQKQYLTETQNTTQKSCHGTVEYSVAGVFGLPGGPSSGHNAMLQTLGFSIGRRPSTLPSGGTGVFVTSGFVPKGTTVAMYPGTVYQAYEPILLQSIQNPFVFRCIDSILIDGNDKGISKMVYRSCSGRDQVGPFKLSDITWLTVNPENPLAVGQYVNNCSNEWAANVCYQEYDVPVEFPLELRQYLPNVNYRHDPPRPLRCAVLVSLRNIKEGEELFSNYYTIVH